MQNQILVDVRTAEEFSHYHKDNAINISIDNIMSGDFGIIKDMPKDSKIECYCQAGGRAEIAKNILNNNGYTNVINIGGLY